MLTPLTAPATLMVAGRWRNAPSVLRHLNSCSPMHALAAGFAADIVTTGTYADPALLRSLEQLARTTEATDVLDGVPNTARLVALAHACLTWQNRDAPAWAGTLFASCADVFDRPDDHPCTQLFTVACHHSTSQPRCACGQFTSRDLTSQLGQHSQLGQLDARAVRTWFRNLGARIHHDTHHPAQPDGTRSCQAGPHAQHGCRSGHRLYSAVELGLDTHIDDAVTLPAGLEPLTAQQTMHLALEGIAGTVSPVTRAAGTALMAAITGPNAHPDLLAARARRTAQVRRAQAVAAAMAHRQSAAAGRPPSRARRPQAATPVGGPVAAASGTPRRLALVRPAQA